MDVLKRIDRFIAKIDQARDSADVAAVLRAQIDELGFERFSYQVLRSRPPRQRTLYVTGYPKDWTKRYVERNYISSDAVSRAATRMARPFSWIEIGRFGALTKDQKAIFDEATEFGIASGAAVPLHGPGQAKAVFTVTSSETGPEFTKLFAARRHELHLVASYTHERLFALGLHDPLQTAVRLTQRETEVMTWTARGKTAWEIAKLLSISQETVKVHLQKACVKLGASNKTHATAVALFHRLIIP